MTEKDFIIWLHGVIDHIKATGIEPTSETINLIEKVMNNINHEHKQDKDKRQLLNS
jgi:hypothetical protein